jgi:hypothetical protein
MNTDWRSKQRLSRLLADELRPGERVVWTGQPSALHGAGGSLIGTAIGVVWIVLSLLGIRDRATLPWFLPLILAACLLVGLWLVLSPVWTVWKNLHTVYMVSNERALLIQAPWRTVTAQTFTGQALESVIRRATRGCRGDLVFEREASEGRHGRTIYRDVGFFGTPDVGRVEQLLPRNAKPT